MKFKISFSGPFRYNQNKKVPAATDTFNKPRKVPQYA